MTPRANVDTVARSGLDILKKVPLFKGLADEQLAELSSVFQRGRPKRQHQRRYWLLFRCVRTGFQAQWD